MTEPAPDGRSRDLEAHAEDDLLAAVRAGDTGAYAMLYRRHHHEALCLARSLGSHDPDDVAQEAFLKILKSILRGGGPRRGFAPYLMRVVRNEAVDRARRTHEDAVDDLERVVPDRFTAPDGVDELFDRQLVRTAFENLPEAWQRILWLTEVEGETPRALAPQLGRSPNAISQLSRRAREGLRTAWLQAHLDTAGATPACRGVAQDLDAHEQGRLTPARSAAVASHLETCARCAAARDELRGLAVQLRSALLPLVLGSPLLLDRLSADVAAVGPSVDGALSPRSPLTSLEAGGRAGVLRGAFATHAGALATLGAIGAVIVGSGLLLGSGHEGPSVFGVATTPSPQQEESTDGTDTAEGTADEGDPQGSDGAAGADGAQETGGAAGADGTSTSSTATTGTVAPGDTATGTAAGGATGSPVQNPVVGPGVPVPTSPPTSSTDGSHEGDPSSPERPTLTPGPAGTPTTDPSTPRPSDPSDAPEETASQTPKPSNEPSTNPTKGQDGSTTPEHPRPTQPTPTIGNPGPTDDPTTDPAPDSPATGDQSPGGGETQDGTPGESDGTGVGGGGTGGGGTGLVIISPGTRPGADPYGPNLPPAGQAPTEEPTEVAAY